MKLKQSIRYQLADFIGPVIVYYGIVVAVHVVLFLAWIFTPATIHLGGGLTVFSGLFLFICGLCSFHDNLPMHLQNGVSRKTMYTAWLVVTVIVSAAMAAADTVLATLIDLLNLPIWRGSSNMFLSLFDLEGMGFGATFVNTLFSFPFSFVLLALLMTLGYFLVVFFYRLPVKLRIVVGACGGIPAVLRRAGVAAGQRRFGLSLLLHRGALPVAPGGRHCRQPPADNGHLGRGGGGAGRCHLAHPAPDHRGPVTCKTKGPNRTAWTFFAARGGVISSVGRRPAGPFPPSPSRRCRCARRPAGRRSRRSPSPRGACWPGPSGRRTSTGWG